MGYMGKVKYYRTPCETSAAWRMSRFMLSDRGNYNGDVGMMILSALDHASDFEEGSAKNAFWHEVAKMLEMERGI